MEKIVVLSAGHMLGCNKLKVGGLWDDTEKVSRTRHSYDVLTSPWSRRHLA